VLVFFLDPFSGWSRMPFRFAHPMSKNSVSNTLLFLALSLLNTVGAPAILIHDTSGCLRETEAPVKVAADLSPAFVAANREHQLAVSLVGDRESHVLIPAQVQTNAAGWAEAVVFLIPPGSVRSSWEFKLVRASGSHATGLQVLENPEGQYDLIENRTPVLRYNYRTIEPGEIAKKVSAGNRIYARARSDYIHPLFGLNGEELTRDWSLDHPHHRGIYWAWPEVDYGTARGDLHALQNVFARPTGKVRIQGGPVFAQIEAESEWMWEDREPVVRELATIRAYRATTNGRFIDLAFQFVALKPGVTVARRDTDKYGGLNIRMAAPQGQAITTFTDVPGAWPRRAWADLSGVFAKDEILSGLAVLQHDKNPDYPGDWVQYPELSWCQPTFPSSGTRYALIPGAPLMLRYRLWIHSGGKPSANRLALSWDAFNASEAARP